MEPKITDMRILVVDDTAANIAVLEELLKTADYTNYLSASDAESVEDLCQAFEPDLILLDLHMPKLSGFEVLAKIRRFIREPHCVPVLVLTADATVEARRRALSLGARDFVTKPLDHSEVLLRIRNALQTRALQLKLQVRNAELEGKFADAERQAEFAAANE